ncbi:hypothetical protein RQN30_01105 [Arcanobacterium hippocoleae]
MDISLSRKLSILAYLRAQGPLPLRDLAAHYGVEPNVMHQELQDLFMVELATSSGYECPIDIDFNDEYSIDDYIALRTVSTQKFHKLQLGFDELMAVVAWIDFWLR